MIYQQGFQVAASPEVAAAIEGYRQTCIQEGEVPSDNPDVSLIQTPDHVEAGEFLVRVATPNETATAGQPVPAVVPMPESA